MPLDLSSELEYILKLHDIYMTIENSRPGDWKYLPLWASNTGPSFHYAWDKVTGADGWEIDFDRHKHQAVFKEDVSLSLAWGIKEGERLVPEFLENYAMAEEAESFWVDIFWNGSLVHRDRIYVFESLEWVHLPQPDVVYATDDSTGDVERVKYTVTPFRVSLARLVHSAEHRDFDEKFARSGFEVIEGAED